MKISQNFPASERAFCGLALDRGREREREMEWEGRGGEGENDAKTVRR